MMFRTAPCRQYHIQTAVIGAGVIGLSAARALSRKGHEVMLLEQSDAIGSGISSRNSEVIHAGIYYDKETMPLKSKFCVEGKRLLYDYCRERDIPHRRCGKLLVATDAEQRDVGLPQLVKYAKRNGVNDLQIVSKEDVADSYSSVYEPSVRCTGAVFSPSTGIVDSHAYMTSLLAEAEEHGATLALQCRVGGGRPVTIDNDKKIALDVDGSEIACDNVVICAGLATHRIADAIVSSCPTSKESGFAANSSQSRGKVAPRIQKQYYAKGNYFKLENQKPPFTRLIYPLPDPKGGLGVHATIDLAGSTKFGPDVEWINKNVHSPDDIDMNVDPGRAESFYAAVRKYFPDLIDGNLVPDYSGIRPKLLHPVLGNFDDGTNRLKDFMIIGPDKHGVKGLTVLLGIESPGLTSSLAIGNYIADTMT